MAIEISSTILILASMALFFIQGFGAHLAAVNGSPRAYFIMSSIVGFMASAAIVLLGPQVLG